MILGVLASDAFAKASRTASYRKLRDNCETKANGRLRLTMDATVNADESCSYKNGCRAFTAPLHEQLSSALMAASTASRRRSLAFVSLLSRSFRSDAVLEVLAKASEAKTPNIILYNYPSFSGAFVALFAHLYHDRLNLPHLVLLFSSFECFKVLAFVHRISVVSRVPLIEECDESIGFQVNLEKRSSRAAYDYFSSKFSLNSSTDASDRVRADGNSELSDEIGKKLSRTSVVTGLRPSGAVIYMQRNNLKMYLRSTDSTTDTYEVAKSDGLAIFHYGEFKSASVSGIMGEGEKREISIGKYYE
nr:uncharacterized protein LOC109161432 [Ipomoea batatas]GMC76593.1 uncharacterized protein LOC109161432 [Ipomoea batatas]